MAKEKNTLVIVESPAKAKTIEKYLGPGYEVVASVGHVRDLPKSNTKAIDIEGGFIPHYEISKGKESVVSGIATLAKKSKEVLLATDPDREGEAIAWHVAIATGLDPDKTKRVVFHEITKGAVEEAIKNPRPIDENLRRAQEARRVLDRLVGYDLSGLIWKKVRYGLSAGRVQSPALRIIMEREREIRAFKPETYWTITADTETKDKTKLLFTCSEEPREEKEMKRILALGKENPWHIVDIKETEAKRSPYAPFTTSTLQQTASSRLGFSPARTMSIAQRLYEAGHITYMRTDSVNLSDFALATAAETIKRLFGEEFLMIRKYTTKSKNAQEAHEAIRPTDLSKSKAGSTPEQQKLYELIRARTLASQMADAKILRTRVTANIKDNSIPDFAANGSQTLFPGWLKADPDAKGEDVELPKLSVNDPLKLIDIHALEKQTEPPARYTEAGLVKELEKRGIGRPSTYASIIKTIQDREYVVKEGRSLKPTDTGDVVSTFLEQNFGEYIGDTFTAEMEDELDLIAEGKAKYEKILGDFYKPFLKEVKAKDKMDKLTTLGDADPKLKCPVCGSPMIVKLGRSGKFLSCSRYPDCTGALMLDGTEMPKDRIIGIYPETGQDITLKSGKFGPYIQVGEKTKTVKYPRRASVPADKVATLTLDEALHLLTLPRKLGVHPETGKEISANKGRFGPYIVHDGDFRSLKAPDDVYTVTLERALEILKEPKKKRGFARKKKADA